MEKRIEKTACAEFISVFDCGNLPRTTVMPLRNLL
jgi:hypothetical protein